MFRTGFLSIIRSLVLYDIYLLLWLLMMDRKPVRNM